MLKLCFRHKRVGIHRFQDTLSNTMSKYPIIADSVDNGIHSRARNSWDYRKFEEAGVKSDRANLACEEEDSDESINELGFR